MLLKTWPVSFSLFFCHGACEDGAAGGADGWFTFVFVFCVGLAVEVCTGRDVT